MDIIVTTDYDALSSKAAQIIAQTIRTKPNAALVVATGNTPLGTYSRLASMVGNGDLDVSQIRVFQLDAYLGVAADDRRSLWRWMRQSFIDPLGLGPQQVIRLPGDATDPDAACADIERRIDAAGGVDLQILGLGPNGHLGFNEPGSQPTARTRVVELTAESIQSSASYWGSSQDVPRQALTLGMDTILKSRRILLLASGPHKADIVAQALTGPVSSAVPASFLQTGPPTTVVLDQEAASKLSCTLANMTGKGEAT